MDAFKAGLQRTLEDDVYQICSGIPVARGSGLKNRLSWVRIPLGVRKQLLTNERFCDVYQLVIIR